MNKKILSLVILCVAFLAGCGRQYQVKPLKHIKREEAHFIEQKEGVELRVQKLKSTEIRQLFNNRSLSKRIICLLITVENNTPKTVLFTQEHVVLKLLSTQDLFSRLSKGTWSKILIVPPACATGAIFSAFVLYPICPIAGLLAAGTVGNWFLWASITGIIVYNSIQFNEELAKDINHKLPTSFTITPGKEESALLFTKDLPETFTITLLKGQEKVPFTVTLKNLETPKVKQSKINQ